MSSHNPLLQPLISTPDTAPSALHFLQVRPDFQKVSFLTAQSFLHVVLSQQGAARPGPFPRDGPGAPPARGSWDHWCLTPSHGAGMSLQRGGWNPSSALPEDGCWLLQHIVLCWQEQIRACSLLQEIPCLPSMRYPATPSVFLLPQQWIPTPTHWTGVLGGFSLGLTWEVCP